MNAWVFLVGAILFEVIGTTFLKLSDSFAKWPWGMGALGCYWPPALKVLPVGLRRCAQAT